MKLEHQVTSLELSKRLKELGVKQDAFWSWDQANDYDDEPRLNRSDEHCPVCTLPQQSFEDKFSAFAVAELGERLPVALHSGKNNAGYRCTVMGGWEKEYTLNDRDLWEITQSTAEADARAKMLIYLLEHKLIDIDDINRDRAS